MCIRPKVGNGNASNQMRWKKIHNDLCVWLSENEQKKKYVRDAKIRNVAIIFFCFKNSHILQTS